MGVTVKADVKEVLRCVSDLTRSVVVVVDVAAVQQLRPDAARALDLRVDADSVV